MQWNINGLQTRVHLGEIQRILKEYNPIAICLQHVNNTVPSIGNYFLASSSTYEEGNLGTAIYIHNKVTYDVITISESIFQISAIKMYLN